MGFLEAGWGGQRKKQDPKERGRGPIGTNQCTHCKEEGRWRNKSPTFIKENRNKNLHQEMLKREGETNDK